MKREILSNRLFTLLVHILLLVAKKNVRVNWKNVKSLTVEWKQRRQVCPVMSNVYRYTFVLCLFFCLHH